MVVQRFWFPLATSIAIGLLGLWRVALAQTAASPAPPVRSSAAENPSSGRSESGESSRPTAATSSSPTDKAPLNAEQSRLAARYKELERVMLRMAEVMQSTDPKRAALLRQAFAQSQQHQIDDQYADLIKLLKDEQLHQAAKGQVAVEQELNRLLELLISGDRDKQIPNERAEIKKFIERVNKLIREQQGIEGETEGQGDTADLAKRQAGAADKAAELSRDIDKFNNRNNPAADAGAKSGENADGKDQDSKAQNGEKSGGKANGKNSDSKNSDGKSPDGKDANTKNANGKNAEDKNAGGKNSDSKNADDQNSDRKNFEDGDHSSDGKASGQKSSDRSGQKAGNKSGGNSGEKSENQKSDEQKPTDAKDGKSDEQHNGKADHKSQGNGKSEDRQNRKSDAKSPRNQKGDSPKGEPQKGDSQKGESPSGDSQKNDSQKGQSQKGQPQDGQPDDENNDNQSPQQSGSQQNEQDENPARKRVRQAEDRMREARRKLEDAQRRGAAEEQRQAVEELKQAKAALEDILRQLREEEIERVLAQLEGRFRKMLQMEVEVYESTIRLDGVPDDERDHELEIQSGKLSRQQTQISTEADKTLNLLREEGSSVAFPESVEEMRDDMQSIAARLSRANVGQITQGIEQDVVKSLEEMVAALQKAQKDQQQQRQAGNQKPQGSMGGNQDQPLVNAIAELKMIRALQVRVNTRTQRYSQLLDDGAEQAEQPDLIEALERLSEREERIHKATREIVVGKNR